NSRCSTATARSSRSKADDVVSTSMRHSFAAVGAALVLVACRPHFPEGAFHGDIPVVFVNETTKPICQINVGEGRHTAHVLDANEAGRKGDVCIAPGARQQLSMASGGYDFSAYGEQYRPVSFGQRFSVSGPTEVVLWDTNPPGPATAGFTRVAIETD